MTTDVTESFTGSATIGTTEYSCPNASTTLTPRTESLWIQAMFNTSAMAAGDQFQFRIYEKVTSGGAQVVLYEAILTGNQTDSYVFPSLGVRHGWDVTVKKLAGTDRSIAWSLRAP